MEIVDPTELEIVVLKEMARTWMKENFALLECIRKYPEKYPRDMYEGKPTYHKLLAGERIHLMIQKLGRNNNDGNRPA